MAKTTPQNFLEMGFTKEMFLGAEDMSVFLQNIIDEIEGLLLGRLGSGAYNAATLPAATYVNRAAKCLIASELCKLRKIKMMGDSQVSGEEPKTAALDKQTIDYAAEAEVWILKITSGTTSDNSDFASGALITDHFGGNT